LHEDRWFTVCRRAAAAAIKDFNRVLATALAAAAAAAAAATVGCCGQWVMPILTRPDHHGCVDPITQVK